MLDFEMQYYDDNIKLIVGIDEAGRGPLCGPVVVSAVILKKDYYNPHINDSKKLTPKQREVAFKEIYNDAIDIGVGIVSAQEIDRINIYEATKIAMLQALNQLSSNYDFIITDAMKLDVNGTPLLALIKGDAKCQCIAAASIVAKVTRDHLMDEYDKKYPQYDFKTNKGYGTKKHLEALKKYGPIQGFHRFTFAPITKKNK